jgi:hypothetical protein
MDRVEMARSIVTPRSTLAAKRLPGNMRAASLSLGLKPKAQ